MGEDRVKRTYNNPVFNGKKNDLAFIVDKKFINLTEHQSTFSPNIPIRFLEYIAKEYQKLHFSNAVYSESLVELPTPEFYVLYNGTKDAPLEQTLKLSDAFVGEYDKISLDLMVKVINVNYEKGADILDRCRTLKEYSMFIHKVRTVRDELGDLDMAIDASIRECISEGILAEFLKNNKGDVMSFLEVNLTEEEKDAIRRQDGYNEAVRDTALKMKEDNMPIETIAKYTGLSKEEIEKL